MYGARVIGEQTELVGVSITPATVAASYTDAVNLSRGRRFTAEVVIPTLSGGAAVAFGLYGAVTSGGTYTLMAGTSIGSETVGNKVYQIEITTDSVQNFNSAYRWLKGYTQATVASAGNVAALIRSHYLRYEPGVDQAVAAQPGIFPPGV